MFHTGLFQIYRIGGSRVRAFVLWDEFLSCEGYTFKDALQLDLDSLLLDLLS